jgi:2-polyprenyl-3-methyl-5-hydroxy-6-metoxy-1,4-benzoquinol methylase
VLETTPVNHQQQIDSHFDGSAQHWRDLYDDQSLEGVIHQYRRSLALRWIDELALPARARVLEVGCGAGLLAIDLAERGYDVDCIDTSSAMVELASAEARNTSVAGNLSVEIGDVHALRFDSSAFDLVLALGVVPFLHGPEKALAEMARVAGPGGRVLLTSDNKFRLNRLFDPRFIPFPGREGFKRVVTGIGIKKPSELPTKLFSQRVARRMLEAAGLEIDRCVTLGFGPFTFLGRELLGEPLGVRLNTWLQDRADRGTVGLRSLGAQHLVLARKA